MYGGGFRRQDNAKPPAGQSPRGVASVLRSVPLFAGRSP